MKLMGGLLVALGLLALAWPAVTYMRREKILKVEPVEATVKKQETISFLPLMGVMALSVGAGLLVAVVITKK